MTAQINDMFLLRDRHYYLAGISGGELFDPAKLGLNPIMLSTACWRGYQAIYSIVDSNLVLRTLHVNHGTDTEERVILDGPIIGGIAPAGREEKHDFYSHYEGINYRLDYTGGLLLARGFITGLYVHMGFHPAWKYRVVIELIFDRGVLTKEVDQSAKMAEIRQRYLEAQKEQEAGRLTTRDEIRDFVERSFDRGYEDPESDHMLDDLHKYTGLLPNRRYRRRGTRGDHFTAPGSGRKELTK